MVSISAPAPTSTFLLQPSRRSCGALAGVVRPPQRGHHTGSGQGEQLGRQSRRTRGEPIPLRRLTRAHAAPRVAGDPEPPPATARRDRRREGLADLAHRLRCRAYRSGPMEPEHFDAQTATLLREIAKRRQCLHELQLRLQQWRKGTIRKGRPPTLEGTRKKIERWLGPGTWPTCSGSSSNPATRLQD